MRRIEEAWRATAEVDGVNSQRSERGWQRNACYVEAASVLADFGLHGFGIRGETRARHDTCMEIAVRAFGLTERDLDVDAEAHELNQNCSIRNSCGSRAKMASGEQCARMR